MKKNRVSLFDIKEWIDRLRKKGIEIFTYNKLPKELKEKTYIQKASDTGFIKSIGNENGRNKWKITYDAKSKQTNGKKTDMNIKTDIDRKKKKKLKRDVKPKIDMEHFASAEYDRFADKFTQQKLP